MPPKQRRAAAGGGQQPQKSTGKQELREQGRETGPSPPDATSEMKSRGSKLRSEFERVMEAFKCSCPTVIQLVGDPSGDATCCLDVGAMLSQNHAHTPAGEKLSHDDVSRLAKELSKHSGLQTIDLSCTCVMMLC